MVLKSVVISPDGDLVNQLDVAFQDMGGIVILKDLDHYPHEHELARVLRTNVPHVVFLGISDLDKALETAHIIEKESPGVQVVAFHSQADPKILLQLMRAGIREFVAPPFHHGSLSEAFARVREQAERRPPADAKSDMVYSFLPSKPGSGTTTIAVNTSLAIARQENANCLLVDLDLNSGLVRFMLKADSSYSVLDAAENAFKMDDKLWPQLVTTRGNLDILHSGKINPGVRVEGSQVRHLLEYARRNYRAICVDLSGNMEKYSIEVMQESKQIFLVCTPEIPSLHLAREKYQFLEKLELGDRVTILLNRTTKRPVISSEQIQSLLGLPVTLSLPNDYMGVHRALTAGQAVDPKSDLGRQYKILADTMLEKRPADGGAKAKPKATKSFTDFFSLSPSKSADPARKS